jgi:hypothetical protein
MRDDGWDGRAANASSEQGESRRGIDAFLLLEGSVDIIPKRTGGDTRCPANGGPDGRAPANDDATGCPTRGADRSPAQSSPMLGCHVCASDGGPEHHDE